MYIYVYVCICIYDKSVTNTCENAAGILALDEYSKSNLSSKVITKCGMNCQTSEETVSIYCQT